MPPRTQSLRTTADSRPPVGVLRRARIRLPHACLRADSSGRTPPAAPLPHAPQHRTTHESPADPGSARTGIPTTNRRKHREHEFSHRRHGSSEPGHRPQCSGTWTAGTPRTPRRQRAPRMEPSAGAAAHARRRVPASSDRAARDPGTRRPVPTGRTRNPAGLIAMGTVITEPPRLLPASMGNRTAGASASHGGVESAPADLVAALSSSPSCMPESSGSRRARPHGASGGTPSSGSASFRRSAMSSRLTRLSRGTSASGNHRASSLDPPTSFRSSPLEHGPAVDDAHRVERHGARVALRRGHDHGVDAEQPVDGCLVPGLLEHLALRRDRRVLRALDPAAGKRPPRPAVLVPVREQDLPVPDDHDVRGDADVHHVTVPAVPAAGAGPTWNRVDHSLITSITASSRRARTRHPPR